VSALLLAGTRYNSTRGQVTGDAVMAVQLDIEYENLVQLVQQLSDDEQKRLIERILSQRAAVRPLTVEEKIQLLDAAKLNNLINEMPSIRREDWYDDDGR
jgi:hypothetical protein